MTIIGITLLVFGGLFLLDCYLDRKLRNYKEKDKCSL